MRCGLMCITTKLILRFFVCFPTQRLICWFRTLKSVLFKKVLEYTFNSILMLKGLMDKQYNNNNYLLLSADSVIDMLHVVSQYSKICLELSLILSLMLRNVCVLNHFSHVRLSVTPMDFSSPGFSVHGILQARILECVAMSSSRGPYRPRDQTSVSCSSCIASRFFTTEPLGKPC